MAVLSNPLPTDPFTLAYQGVFNCLLAWPGFTSLLQYNGGAIKLGNINDLTNQGQFTKSGPKDSLGAFADTPEITLSQRKFILDPTGRNSTSVNWWQDFPLVMVGATGLYVPPINQLKWQTMIALAKGGNQFQPFGLNFIDDWQVTDGLDDVPVFAVPTNAATRGEIRDVTLLNIRLHGYASKKDLFNLTFTP